MQTGFGKNFDTDFLGPEEEREAKVSARIFDAARRAAGQIPFMEDVIAGYYCALDPATPRRVRGGISPELPVRPARMPGRHCSRRHHLAVVCQPAVNRRSLPQSLRSLFVICIVVIVI